MGTGSGYWNFIVNEDGWWTWTHTDSHGNQIARSEGSFRYFHTCVEDAKKHGYRDPKPRGGSEFRCFF